MFESLVSFIASFPAPLASFLLGATPISEIRGAIIFAFQQGNLFLILYGILGNMFAGLCLLAFWNLLKIQDIGLMIVGKRISKMIERYHRNHELGETIALALFIGVPLPVTGVYSGVLLAKVLKISNKKIAVASVCGILMASIIMYLALSGAVSFLNVFT
ncbi:MAG: small multi-drug export protein [Candidatus Micrarchaeota archaeon]